MGVASLRIATSEDKKEELVYDYFTGSVIYYKEKSPHSTYSVKFEEIKGGENEISFHIYISVNQKVNKGGPFKVKNLDEVHRIMKYMGHAYKPDKSTYDVIQEVYLEKKRLSGNVIYRKGDLDITVDEIRVSKVEKTLSQPNVKKFKHGAEASERKEQVKTKEKSEIYSISIYSFNDVLAKGEYTANKALNILKHYLKLPGYTLPQVSNTTQILKDQWLKPINVPWISHTMNGSRFTFRDYKLIIITKNEKDQEYDFNNLEVTYIENVDGKKVLQVSEVEKEENVKYSEDVKDEEDSEDSEETEETDEDDELSDDRESKQVKNEQESRRKVLMSYELPNFAMLTLKAIQVSNKLDREGYVVPMEKRINTFLNDWGLMVLNYEGQMLRLFTSELVYKYDKPPQKFSVKRQYDELYEFKVELGGGWQNDLNTKTVSELRREKAAIQVTLTIKIDEYVTIPISYSAEIRHVLLLKKVEELYKKTIERNSLRLKDSKKKEL
jgi:hypothetical protein